MGLLDNGARFTHVLLSSPSHIDFKRDCVHGGSHCATPGPSFDPAELACGPSHGTSSAAILVGNTNMGHAFRGVTGIVLDSFKIYESSDLFGSCLTQLVTSAALRGFQTAVAVLDRVILAEVAGGGTPADALATAADHAFDTGAVVLAPNGNDGPGAATVRAPANAHKVIGVGAYSALSPHAQYASQGRGPAPDGRIKPDVQAPTGTETADKSSDTALSNYPGTSGAAPYATGAAGLLRNWLRQAMGHYSIDPGQVYAQLILSAQHPAPFGNIEGAGKLRLPTDGWSWWGKLTIPDGATIDIPLYLPAGTYNYFDGALWWPESFSEAHSRIELILLDPTNTVRATSDHAASVFQRARAAENVVGATGPWILRIRGHHVPGGPQVIYWSAAAWHDYLHVTS